MVEQQVLDQLISIVGKENIKTNELLKNHTSFKIGGPADLFISPKSIDELLKIIGVLNKTNENIYYIGNGCNLLVSDKGFRGIIINLSGIREIKVEGNFITAACGAQLRDIAKNATENSLTGYEFASGIPGTIGGATCMNAGAYDGEHKNVIESVTYLEDGMIKEADNKACNFGYRQSIFKNSNKVILSVKIRLKPGEKEAIQEKVKRLTEQRILKQPLDYPSAGSTFKRPQGYFAGKLIQDNGFKGKQIGGAAVSEKHSGFIINKNDATAKDVLDLIHLIQKTVKENNGVDLEPEVIFIGENYDEDDA